MSIFHTAVFLGALIASVSAHGHVTGVVSNGEWHAGTTPQWIYQAEKPNTAGWYAENQDNGYVDPTAYADGDIVCHKAATPGLNSIPVTAGKSIDIQWNTWPESHHGPVLDYLAPVSGEFADIDKTALQFFKIDESGLIDGSTAPGKWASDDLIANNITWSVTIPASIAPGKYVLRHEIIALHSAGDTNGAQNYPQCLNIEVTSDGSETPAGVPATSFYKADDAGIKVGIYNAPLAYTIPGPALYSDGGSGSSPSTSTGSATPSASASTTAAAGSASSTQPPYSNTTAIVTSSSYAAVPTTTTATSKAEEYYASSTPEATATATTTAFDYESTGAPTFFTEAPSATATSTSAAYASASATASPTATSTSAPSSDYGSKPEKDLPEGFTVTDLQQWVAYLIKQGWSSQSRNHARDFRV